MEAIIAAVIVLGVAVFVSNMSYGTSITRRNANVEDAVYDFSNMLYRNATVYGCVTNYDAACIKNIIGVMRSVYGLRYIGLREGNLSVESGSICSTYKNFCYGLRNGDVACIMLCGD